MRIEIIDYWTLRAHIDALSIPDGPAHIVLAVTQPHGYAQRFELDVAVNNGATWFDFVYPLIDDGRFVPSPLPRREAPQCWPGGFYRFTVTVRWDGGPPQSTAAALNVEDFRDQQLGRAEARPTADHQFLECAPHRAVVINHDKQGFWLRTIADRVEQCAVEVDVVAPDTLQPLAGPWRFDLTKRTRRKGFNIKTWPSGEYWIRLRALSKDEPVGAYCVRMFVVEKSTIPVRPDVLEVGTSTLPAVDHVLFDQAQGAVFAPVTLETIPEGPPIEPTEPWEMPARPCNMGIQSIRRNKQTGQFEMIYSTSTYKVLENDPGGDRPQQDYLAVSSDGVTWHKPDLGRYEFNGSTANNIVGNEQPTFTRGKKDKESVEALHEIEHARFRYYDADRDGPVNMDMVFHPSGGAFPTECKNAISARKTPEPREGDDLYRGLPSRWHLFEQRGDDYIVLNRRPLLIGADGLDLNHTTESCRFHVEIKPARKLFFYFRPTGPMYPPNWTNYDNLWLGRRTMGVLWTEDGQTFHKHHALSPDEYDHPADVFYSLRIIAPEGTDVRAAHGRTAMRREQYPQVALNEQPIYMGTVLHYNLLSGTLWPEIIWSIDLIRWHRFEKQRRPWIELGPYGSFNWAQARDQTESAYQFDDEWWFPYSAGNWTHGSLMVHRIDSFEEISTHPRFKRYTRLPSFKSWEDFYKLTRQARSVTAIGRTRVWRLVSVEPSNDRANLTTKPLRVGGDVLYVNAAVGDGGQVRAELRDGDNRPIPGYALDACEPFRGNAVDHPMRWSAGRDTGSLVGRVVRVHFVLEGARLFAMRFGRRG